MAQSEVCTCTQSLLRIVGCRRFPRSTDNLTRDYAEGDIVVFISHRWWSSERPDDEQHVKYSVLTDGLHALIALEQLDSSRVVIWCDYACIAQDDADLLRRGVESLVTYAARSTAVLIPVHPTDFASFDGAVVPQELANYGDRAWCRLEIFVFFCLAEITMRPLRCYGYGRKRNCWARGVFVDRGGNGLVQPGNAAQTVTKRRSVAEWVWRLCSIDPYFVLDTRTYMANVMAPSAIAMRRGSKLVKFGKCAFNFANLPSRGRVTKNSDLLAIAAIEEEVRSSFVRFSILAEHFNKTTKYSLKGKQVADADIDFLIDRLEREEAESPATGRRLKILDLSDNLFSYRTAIVILSMAAGARRHCDVCPAFAALEELDLSGNVHIFDQEERAADLAAAIGEIKILRLRRCNISPLAAQGLAKGLEMNQSLLVLDLSENPRIKDDDVARLAATCGDRCRLCLTGCPLLSSSIIQRFDLKSLVSPDMRPSKTTDIIDVQTWSRSPRNLHAAFPVSPRLTDAQDEVQGRPILHSCHASRVIAT